MSRKHKQPNSKIILFLFSLLFVILLLGTWVSAILVQEQQDLRNQAYIAEVTGFACNESCSSHSQCQSNFICFDSHCRLSTNPTSETCQGIPDQGIHRSCNEYCADHNECEKGLVCYYNTCRNPYNVTNESCSLPTPVPTQRSTITKTPTPFPTVTLPAKGGVFSTTMPSKSPIPTATTSVNTITSTTPIMLGDDRNTSPSSTTQDEFLQESNDSQTSWEFLSSIPSYVLYGIGTLIVFFVALVIYIIHSWKMPKKLRAHNPTSSSHASPYDMKNFAGNMDAHVKKDEKHI